MDRGRPERDLFEVAAYYLPRDKRSADPRERLRNRTDGLVERRRATGLGTNKAGLDQIDTIDLVRM